MDKDLKIIYRKTGIFVFAAILILVSFILFIAQQQRIFARKYQYYTVLEDSIGLDKASPIVFKGTEIGRIRDFTFNEERNVEVHFHIYHEFRDLIVAYSAITKNVNPLSGRASLDFLMGPLDGELKEERSLIPSLDMEEGKTLLTQRRVRTRPDQISTILSNLGQFAENLNRDDNYHEGSFFRMIYHLAYVAENLNSSLINFNDIMVSLQHDHYSSEGALFRLTVNLANLAEDMRISNSLLAQNLINIDKLIENYSQPDDLIIKMLDPSEEKIINPLIKSLQELAQSMENITQMTEYFNHQTPELSILMSETNKTLSELQKTLQGINNNPLIRGGIKQPVQPAPGERIRLMEGE